MRDTVVLLLTMLTLAVAQPESWDKVLMAPSVMPNDLQFLADGIHGWMVGSAGAGGETRSAMLATTDRGVHWTELPIPDTSGVALGGVHFVSSTTGWVVGSGGCIRKTTDAGATWQAQSSPVTRKLTRVHFVSASTGWITGGWNDGSQFLVLKTTNGGQSWQDLSFGSGCYSCEDIWFADSLNGWLVGQNSSINPFIQHTTDGGATWTQQSAPIPSGNGPVSSICFPTPTRGWAVVSSIYQSPAGSILSTTNAGDSWYVQGNTNLHYNYALDAPDTMHVAILSTQVLGTAQGRVIWTTNGGQGWFSQSLPTYSYGYGCQYRGDDIWVAQDNSQVYHSPDNGSTWDWQLYAPLWRSISWSCPSVGWLVTGSSGGRGYCLKSNDNGATWERASDAPGGTQVRFIDSGHGWMLIEGNNARIFQTTDAGVTWNEYNVGTGNWVGRMAFATLDSGWCCGSQGTMRFTFTGGAGWSAQNLNTSSYCEDVFMLNSREGWAVGGYGGGSGFIRHTTDGGQNWGTQNPVTTAHINRVFFHDGQLGWAGCYGGSLQRTTDGGLAWLAAGSVPHFYIEDILFVDARTGWLAAGNAAGGSPGEDGRGFIYKTTDGGTSWNLEYRAAWPRGWVQDIDPQPGGSLWACGGHGSLLFGGPPQWVEALPTTGSPSPPLRARPNPFVAATEIRYQLTRPGRVILSVRDAAGRRLATLVDGFRQAGAHSAVWDGSGLAAGIYFCRLEGQGDSGRLRLCRR